MTTIPSSSGETTRADRRDPPSVRIRLAQTDDAAEIAMLHADSWRRHYRGAYADSYLDGDLETDRRSVWSARLAASTHSATLLAEHDGRLVGFVHVVLDEDPRWGSLVDNLHVVHDRRRMAVGTRLLSHAVRAVSGQATGNAMCLWVLRQNTPARQFYRARGATCAETATVSPPGGDPTRLHGAPRKLRMVWPDVTEDFRA
ncbi:GNAT family N-acetyltransferase [Micromonospora auratinigra]|uniref:Ribosomal protein S18 acetylase RimI n=1 Tax=Micromonospora auratinigra TaxID=261654 RepID=A0A1A8ZRT9_9ACTN|nr:GNAT family N-acetyltransferase [Micromonospora auratinigra]SBT46603.1 Ribosomal protein S18 acetylase RimI [Micromonospora auratinigra]